MIFRLQNINPDVRLISLAKNKQKCFFIGSDYKQDWLAKMVLHFSKKNLGLQVGFWTEYAAMPTEPLER